MVARKQNTAADEQEFAKVAKSVTQVELDSEVETSFLEYAYYVIGERAIPDARDGLKPVQRRILYSMFSSGFGPDKQHVKSARIVGEVMGRLHPHGDSAIYEAMVRLAQPFTMNVPLIDGRGNFGDRPGAGAAAQRYTESRLSEESLLMVSELRERPVEFMPNYDQEWEQPVVLPNQFPALIVNGISGIAVGFATNMAPHNPGEVLDATRWLLTHPNADLDKLMTFLPGPDFPTGCQVLGSDGIREAYETGRGKVTIRAQYRIEDAGRGKKNIVFYEIPYEVNSEKVIEQIKSGLKENKLQGIADVKDLTDRKNGIRLVIEAKAGFNIDSLVAMLYKHTQLEDSFNFNNIALVPDGSPQLLGLKELLQLFIDHRLSIIVRRSENRKEKRAARLHLVEGLLKALANIDEVIRIVRSAADATVAQANLMKKFKIDEVQADYILSIPLRRLTKFDQLELNNEKKKLVDEIAELTKIITDDAVLRQVCAKELEAVKKIIDRPRRSVLIDGALAEHLEATKAAVENGSLEVEDEPCAIFLSPKGGLVRSSKLTPSRPMLSAAVTTTRGKFIAVTNKGNAYRIDALHVGTREAAASNALPAKLPSGEKVIAVTPVALPEGKSGGIAMGTRNGVVKITAPQWPVRSDDFTIIGLEKGDEILSATWVEDVEAADLAFISTDSSLLIFPANKVRPQGLSGAGMAGMKLAPGAVVSSFSVIPHSSKDAALVITHTGKTVKATPFNLYPQKGRATGGVRSHKFLRGEDKLALSVVSPIGVLFTAAGEQVTTPAIDTRRDGSGVKAEADSLF